MHFFCTLFDSSYLVKGLCMYESLEMHCKDFRLFIFAFDEPSYRLLNRLNLSNAIIISLQEFEDEELLAVKSDRTKAEYCWTSTPSTIYYCIIRYNLPHCTYLDADLYFYSDPAELFIEMSEHDDVLITEHRYTPEYDQTELSGKYCVQFVFFRNTENGMHILQWWRNACLEWCYARREAGKFGDQKYLDDWTSRFQGVHELQHHGGGLAPWNVQQYQLRNSKKLFVKRISTNHEYTLIFFHFHHIHVFKSRWIIVFDLGEYPLSRNVRRLLYIPYIKHLKMQNKKICKMEPGINSLGTSRLELKMLRYMAYIIKNLIKPNRINWIRLWQN